MPQPAIYDEDILLWSEQQAEMVRKLGHMRRDLPNEFDVENVAEEIESVGRSELAAVKSLIRQILGHLLKLGVEPEGPSVRRWLGEILTFRAELEDRYAPSMRQRIDLDRMWNDAVEEFKLKADDAVVRSLVRLPRASPFTLDEVISREPSAQMLARRLRDRMTSTGPTDNSG